MVMFLEEKAKGICCTAFFMMKARDLLSMDEEQAEAFASQAQQFGKPVKAGDYQRIPCLKLRDYAKGEFAYLYRGMYAVVTDGGMAISLHQACRGEKPPKPVRSGFGAKKIPVYNRKKLQRYIDHEDAWFYEA